MRMRVQLAQPNHVDDLVRFLRRCDCLVLPLGGGLVDVTPRGAGDDEELLRLTRAGLCYGCGSAVEPALSELGSPLCHDCRGTRERQCAALVRHSAMLEIETYLRVWNVLHPAAATTIVDG